MAFKHLDRVVSTLCSLCLNLNSWLHEVFGTETSSHALGSYCCALTILCTLTEILQFYTKKEKSSSCVISSRTIQNLIKLSDVFYTNLRHNRTSTCPLLDAMTPSPSIMSVHPKIATEIVDICVINRVAELKHILSMHFKYDAIKDLKSKVDFTSLKGRLSSNEILSLSRSLYVDDENLTALTSLGSFIDSVLLKRLNRSPSNELLLCLCGCVSNLYHLKTSKDEGVWGGLNLLTQRAYKTCEKVSRDRQLKHNSLRCMVHFVFLFFTHSLTHSHSPIQAMLLLQSRPQFKKSHMEPFLKKRVLTHLTNKAKVPHCLDVLVLFLRGSITIKSKVMTKLSLPILTMISNALFVSSSDELPQSAESSSEFVRVTSSLSIYIYMYTHTHTYIQVHDDESKLLRIFLQLHTHSPDLFSMKILPRLLRSSSVRSKLIGMRVVNRIDSPSITKLVSKDHLSDILSLCADTVGVGVLGYCKRAMNIKPYFRDTPMSRSAVEFEALETRRRLTELPALLKQVKLSERRAVEAMSLYSECASFVPRIYDNNKRGSHGFETSISSLGDRFKSAASFGTYSCVYIIILTTCGCEHLFTLDSHLIQ